MRGLHLRKPGNTLSHIDTMKTLNSEPRITLNWMTGAWGVPAFTYATPSKKAAAFDLSMAMAELASVAAERDKLKAERDNARQSLRAAEADAAETESVNSDLRTVNARLVADLAAATQRADTAEAILRAKA